MSETVTTGEVAATSEVVVARVAVDVPLAHLDRAFDYLVPEELRDQVRPGVRVRVKFAGRRRDGYVLAVSDHSDTEAPLKSLERVVSPEVVLTPAIAGLIRDVADRYAGTFADVVRLAVPPRHGVAEKARRPDYPAPIG
ncbi:MAG: primosomal protein N', partial [Propionibacteriaceae bacterium]